MNTLEEQLDMSSDEALISALTPKQLGELELQPFSLMRQLLVVPLRRANDGYFNAVMTVWICTLTPTEALKATEDRTQAQLRAFEWAEAQGYTLLNFEPLWAIYLRLDKELEASTRARSRDSGDGQKKIPGEPQR